MATGRPIVFSLCQYGQDASWRWAAGVGGNLWRTTDDIQDNYARMATIGFAQAGLAKYAGPGHWNDPDMLEIGNGGMTDDEYRTHMSLWAILAAPLLAGNDLSKMTPETVALLTNREVIAVDQDRLGREGDRVWAEGPLEIWVKPLAGGAKAVGLFNRNERAQMMELPLALIGEPASAHLRDLWKHEAVEAGNGVYRVEVPRHGVVMLKVSR
jgi:alpha-galactosidase